MSVNAVLDREERPPLVRFEKRAIEDKKASRETGQVIYKDVNYVMVTPPYSKDCYEHKAELWFEQVEKNVRNGRTPQKWFEAWKEGYEKWKQGEEIPLNGTSIKNWSAITQAQCKTLLVANILTIEDLAQVNDEGLRRLGMGGMELKNKALAYIKAAKDTGPLVMENAALKKEIEQQKGTIDSLSEKIDILSNKLSSMQAQPLVEIEDILEPDTSELLTERYIKKFGKKPHHLMKEETIRRKLAE